MKQKNHSMSQIYFFTFILFNICQIHLNSISIYKRLKLHKKQRSMFSIFFIVQFFLSLGGTNLVINGDFQLHPAIATYSSLNLGPCYVYWKKVANASMYFWYDDNNIGVQFTANGTVNTVETMTTDLCSSARTMLCQQILLNQAFYQLKFDICKNYQSIKNHYSVLLGSLYLAQNQVIDVGGCFRKQIIFLFNNSLNNTLCFTGSGNNPLSVGCTVGPILDNITLIQLANYTIIVGMSIQFITIQSQTIIIQTNVSVSNNISDEPFTQTFMQQIFENITIDGVLINNSIVKNCNSNYLCVQIPQIFGLSFFNITLHFKASVVGINYYQFVSGNVNCRECSLSLTKSEFDTIKWMINFNMPITVRLRESLRVSRFLGIGYLFFQIFSFWHIAIFHNYLFIETPYFVKIFAENNFKNFMEEGLFRDLQIDEYIYHSFQLPIDEKIPSTLNKWSWFRELGFTSNFYVNSLQCLLFLFFGLLKSGLMHLIFIITGWKYFKMKDYWFGNFTFDLMSWAPFIILVPCIMINNFSLKNSLQKLNMMVHLVLLFMCFIIPFIFIVNRFSLAGRLHKSKLKVKQRDSKQIKNESKYQFIDLLFFSVLTMLTGLSIKDGFLLASYILVIIKIKILISSIKHISKIQLFFKMAINALWLIYTSIFTCYRIMEIIQKNNSQILDVSIWFQCKKYLGIVSIFVFVFGGYLECFHVVVKIFIEIIKAILNFLQYIKEKAFRNQIFDDNKQERETKQTPKEAKQTLLETNNKNLQQKNQQIYRKKNNNQIQIQSFSAEQSQINVQKRIKFKIKQYEQLQNAKIIINLSNRKEVKFAHVNSPKKHQK